MFAGSGVHKCTDADKDTNHTRTRLQAHDYHNCGGILLPFNHAEHLDEWRVLFDSSSPHTEPLPPEFQARLGSFQRLLLLRALRQDKLTQAITKYVADTMGRWGEC